jgi:mRNA-degrading endonuclease RelE of RelBE toxin-antitoxin system
MYRIVITPSAGKSAKKLPRNVRKEIINQSQKLKENPYLGEKLSSSLHFLYSFHIKLDNVEYRLAYTINESKKFIIVHLVGPRENFYEKLKRIFG